MRLCLQGGLKSEATRIIVTHKENHRKTLCGCSSETRRHYGIGLSSSDLEISVQRLRDKRCKSSNIRTTTNSIKSPSQDVADNSPDPLPAIEAKTRIGKRTSMEVVRKVIFSDRLPQGSFIDAMFNRAVPGPTEARRIVSEKAGLAVTEVTMPR